MNVRQTRFNKENCLHCNICDIFSDFKIILHRKLLEMKISVAFEDNLYSLDISDDSEIEILKTLLEFESGLPPSDFAIYYNGVQMREMKKTLKYYGVKDGEVLVMTRRLARPPQRSSGGTLLLYSQFLSCHTDLQI